MNECPTCGRRIRGRICPYCDEELLESDEAETLVATGEDLVEVFHCRTEAQADFITSLLESEGIPTVQAPGASLETGRKASGRARGISIQVTDEDANRARDLIEAAKEDLEAEDN